MKHMNVALFVPHLGCPHRCAFCDQNAISGSGAPITADEIVAVTDGKQAEFTLPHDGLWEIDAVMTKSFYLNPVFENSFLTTDQIKDLILSYNPNATYADLVAPLTRMGIEDIMAK